MAVLHCTHDTWVCWESKAVGKRGGCGGVGNDRDDGRVVEGERGWGAGGGSLMLFDKIKKRKSYSGPSEFVK